MDEVAYARCATPHGQWWFAWSAAGLVASAPGDDEERDFLARLPRPVHRGRPEDVPVDVDWAAMPAGFRGEVMRALMDVGQGEVISYGALAARAGRPRAARAVGTTMATNPLPLIVPCHRVIRSDGSLGEYGAGGPERKAQMLAREGVDMSSGRLGGPFFT